MPAATSGQLFITTTPARFQTRPRQRGAGFSKAHGVRDFSRRSRYSLERPDIPDTLTDLSFGIGIGLAKTEK